jgi:hypothetical protein
LFRNPDNLELENSSSKTRSFAFYQKETSSVKKADLRDMFKKPSKNVCTSTTVLSPDPLSPTPSTSSAMKIPENTEVDSVDCELADEGDIQMEYSSY